MKNNTTACIESFYISTIYKIFFLIICGCGIRMHISPLNIDHNIHMFSYFTVLSNLFCFIMIFICVYKDIKNKITCSLKKIFYSPVFSYSQKYSFFKGMSLMGIILTAIIYHFMVAKYKYPLLYNNILCLPQKDLLAHYIIPLMYVFDWLLFQPKNLNNLKMPIYWLIYPLIYMITIMFRAFCLPHESILYLDKFPYFFLDIRDIGFTSFMLFTILLLLVIIAIGYTILGIEKLICFIAHKFF